MSERIMGIGRRNSSPVPRNTKQVIAYCFGLTDSIPASRLTAMRGTKAYERCVTALETTAPETAGKASLIATAVYQALEDYSAFRYSSTAHSSIALFELALYDYCESVTMLHHPKCRGCYEGQSCRTCKDGSNFAPYPTPTTMENH